MDRGVRYQLQATPNGETDRYKYYFSRWTDVNNTLVSYSNPYTVEISQDTTFYACFYAVDKTTGLVVEYPENLYDTYFDRLPEIVNTETPTNEGMMVLMENGSRKTSIEANCTWNVGRSDVPNNIELICGAILSTYHNAEVPNVASLDVNQTIQVQDMYCYATIAYKMTYNHIVSGNKDFGVVFNNVKPGSVYFVRPFIKNAVSILYGQEVVVFTEIDPNANSVTQNGLNGIFAIQPYHMTVNGKTYTGAMHRIDPTIGRTDGHEEIAA